MALTKYVYYYPTFYTVSYFDDNGLLQYSKNKAEEVIRNLLIHYSLLYWGIREVTQDRIELSSFLIYSINTFTIASRNRNFTAALILTITLLTHCYNSLNYH